MDTHLVESELCSYSTHDLFTLDVFVQPMTFFFNVVLNLKKIVIEQWEFNRTNSYQL